MLTGADSRNVRSADARTARLAVSLSGTNLARAGDYNQRTVLQAIRLAGETTRVELSRQTGLTAPTIANITGRLLDAGLIRVNGRTRGARGQPAFVLSVDPDGAFSIGINIDRDHVTMMILDLAGQVRSRASCDIAFALPEQVTEYVRRRIEPLLAAGRVDRERVLGVGVARPDDLGRIALPHRPAGYERWSTTDLADLLGEVLPWPVHVDNDAAAAALGEAQRRSGGEGQNFFYLLISAGLGGGPVIDGNYYRGADLRSGEIGLMPDPAAARPDAVVQDTVSLSALGARLEAAGCSVSPAEPDAAAEEVIASWIADATRSLHTPLVAVNCLLNPAAILIGGRLPLPLTERLAAALETALADAPIPSRAPILPATEAEDAAVIGAAILPFLDHVLPSDAILIQAGRAV